MKTAKGHKGSGGKLARRHIVQARITDEAREGLELLAKEDGRTVSSYVWQLIESDLKERVGPFNQD